MKTAAKISKFIGIFSKDGDYEELIKLPHSLTFANLRWKNKIQIEPDTHKVKLTMFVKTSAAEVIMKMNRDEMIQNNAWIKKHTNHHSVHVSECHCHYQLSERQIRA